MGLNFRDWLQTNEGLQTLDYHSDHRAVQIEMGRLEEIIPREIYNFKNMRIQTFNAQIADELTISLHCL